MFALSLTVYEIFAKQEKCQNFNLENEGQGQGVEKWDLRYSTRRIPSHIGEFAEFEIPGNIRLRKIIRAHTFTARDMGDNL